MIKDVTLPSGETIRHRVARPCYLATFFDLKAPIAPKQIDDVVSVRNPVVLHGMVASLSGEPEDIERIERSMLVNMGEEFVTSIPISALKRQPPITYPWWQRAWAWLRRFELYQPPPYFSFGVPVLMRDKFTISLLSTHPELIRVGCRVEIVCFGSMVEQS